MNQRVIADPSQHGWTEVDGKWVWDAESGGAGAGMVISETEPTDKVEGMQWLNPTTGLVLFWDDEKWLQMPTTGAAGKDGKDAVWSEDANGANYTGTVTVKGELLAAKADAGENAVAVGTSAGKTSQGASAVAVGRNAGSTGQGVHGLALGNQAGHTNQGGMAIAVGLQAGETDQGESAVAVGQAAGYTNQGEKTVAVGYNSGVTSQGNQATAVGYLSGYENQGLSTVAVGYMAGYEGQGDSAIAIGEKAGQANQAANGIIINSTGDAIDNTGANHIQIQSAPTKYLLYNGSNSWTFSGGTVNGLNGFRQNGAPVIDAKGLISTLSTLRNATKDETTLEGMRDALAGSISGLIEGLEHEIATQEISE